ncbi:hypothetical protein FB645_005560 [Coemansia sp. IMI 203386]|nr:hypothetical protein FB645_005560 [Coemansia sp. IMI 203386]
MANIADSVAAAGSARFSPQSPLCGPDGYPRHHDGAYAGHAPVLLAPHQPPRPHDLYNAHAHAAQAARHHYGAAYSHHPYMPPGDDAGPRSPLAGAEERERKRRISHSAMERRRRERTNNIINELKALIPWLRDEARLQKLEVLEQCVCYIKELQASAAGSRVPPAAPRRATCHASDDDCASPSLAASPCPPSCAPSAPAARPLSATAPPDLSTHALHAAADADTGRRRLSSSDLPDLVDCSASSKASSTVSTIGPFRGTLPKDLADAHPPSPGSKNSIGFLTS